MLPLTSDLVSWKVLMLPVEPPALTVKTTEQLKSTELLLSITHTTALRWVSEPPRAAVISIGQKTLAAAVVELLKMPLLKLTSTLPRSAAFAWHPIGETARLSLARADEKDPRNASEPKAVAKTIAAEVLAVIEVLRISTGPAYVSPVLPKGHLRPTNKHHGV